MIVDRCDPDVTVVKVYSPQHGQIQVHLNGVAQCPPELPWFFWYGTRRSKPGRPVEKLLRGDLFDEQEADVSTEGLEADRQTEGRDTAVDEMDETNDSDSTTHPSSGTNSPDIPPSTSLSDTADITVG